ncbi:hypothetical protein KUF54_06710 [Comamonas sp. Y33R10-2]|uniref:hypothetical protein n=1 Tax=Comamonas sp. Y33R10-2 TaxID=2853257 RepID=UPI001C5CA1BD|nr:hypothetical protein [Comamonas sp. Y33R10-2]QXZ10884.1 hypothetical protein KUF54_06710 [Comamonas sp. Y33R10-2]
MKIAKLTLIACAAMIVSGCATFEEASSSLSCMLSRVTNAGDPKCATGGGSSAPATAISGGHDERFSRLQAALNQETQRAQGIQTQAVQAMQTLPVKQRAVAGAVLTQSVSIADAQSGKTLQMRAFSSLSVEMPLAAKGRKEYTAAMDLLKELANELADNRGSSSIVVDQSDADVKAGRVNTATGTTQSKGGKPVTVIKRIDAGVPSGVERYTIEAGAIRGKL